MIGKIPNLPEYVVIVGPTAVGKTDVSIQIAKHFNGEIISADSRLFYRGMDIGTAKPTKEELLSVRHHLIDVADPDETWSLSKYHRRVYQLLEEITQREKLPVLVGGTGQYIFSIIENWKIPEVRPDQDMRDALYDWVDKISPSGLYERLVHIDPEVEAIIQPENVRRTVRALEVIFHSGKKFTDSRGPGPQLYQPIMIGLSRSREILYQRIDQRLDRMLENGFIKEVKALIEEGYPPDSPAFSAIGYRQLIAYLQGYISLKDAIMEIRKSSRILVRRQSNWFKQSDERIKWFDMETTAIQEIIQYIESRLQEVGKP